jgi:hypothetical protein
MNGYSLQKTFLIISLASVSLVGCRTLDYDTGRDTVEAFGNGRYQILRSGNTRSLCDSKKLGGDCEPVESWTSNSQYAYAVILESSGIKPRVLKKKLVLIDLQTEQSTQYDSLDKVPAPHQSTFSELIK